jgi:hypothetical protein
MRAEANIAESDRDEGNHPLLETHRHQRLTASAVAAATLVCIWSKVVCVHKHRSMMARRRCSHTKSVLVLSNILKRSSQIMAINLLLACNRSEQETVSKRFKYISIT